MHSLHPRLDPKLVPASVYLLHTTRSAFTASHVGLQVGPQIGPQVVPWILQCKPICWLKIVALQSPRAMSAPTHELKESHQPDTKGSRTERVCQGGSGREVFGQSGGHQQWPQEDLSRDTEARQLQTAETAPHYSSTLQRHWGQPVLRKHLDQCSCQRCRRHHTNMFWTSMNTSQQAMRTTWTGPSTTRRLTLGTSSRSRCSRTQGRWSQRILIKEWDREHVL